MSTRKSGPRARPRRTGDRSRPAAAVAGRAGATTDPTAFVPASPEEMRRVFTVARAYFNPEFLGLWELDLGKPALWVGNHTLFGLTDAPLMVEHLYTQYGVMLRGLGDRGHFDVPWWGDMLVRNGMVLGTPENCAALMDAGQENTLEASMCKVKAGAVANAVSQKAVELLGPEGYSCKLLVEKWMRDARINDIYEGTGQINRLVVARRLLGYSSRELR